MTKIILLLALFSSLALASGPFISNSIQTNQIGKVGNTTTLIDVQNRILFDTSSGNQMSWGTGGVTFPNAPTFSSMTIGSVLFSGTAGILSQDNANFFWDATNHRLGLGTASPASLLTIKNGPDDNVHGIRFLPASGSEFFDLYTSGTATLQLRDPFQNVGLWQVNNQGRMAVAGASIGHPDATFLNENQPGVTGIPTYAAKKQTSQTADFLDFYDTDETTVLFGVSIAGKMSAMNIQDKGLSTGCLQSDSLGNVSSGTCFSGTMTAVSVASANGFAGSSSGGATPAITITTTVNSPVLSGNGTAVAAGTTTGSGSTVVLATGPTMTNPIVGTQSPGDNTTKAASTAFVTAAVAASGGGCVVPVLTKTTSYTVLTGDFTCANKEIMVEMNCSADCVLTFPAASNSGFKIDVINIGSATATATLAGSDTYGSTSDQTWIMPPGGSPQVSNFFMANGGSRWNGF